MIELLREFSSWYWTCDFADPELRDAYEATGTATTPEELEQAFLVLLRNDDTVARGTALDFFDRAEALTRFGEANPFAGHTAEVFAVARELLRQPPRPADEYADEGANHASALRALKSAAGPEDADAVAEVLARHPDGSLLENALTAAGTILENSAAPDPRLFESLTGLATDRSLPIDEREHALVALRELPGPAVTAILVRAIEDGEWQIQHEAAWGLFSHGRFYAHRALLTRLAESLPDRCRPLKEHVRAAAEDGPHSLYWTDAEPETEELRTAHRELRAPTTEAAHRQAFRLMLHSGQKVATGIALDHFHMAGGLTRFGLDVDEYVPEVIAVATGILAASPDESALHVLGEYAEPENAAAITAVLRRRDLPSAVADRAVRAAAGCLERWGPDERVVAALGELVLGDSVDVDLREDAVVVLSDLYSPQVTAVLVRAARVPEPAVQVEAAVALSESHLIDEHRDLLRTLTASWPDEAGRRAWIVRSRLR